MVDDPGRAVLIASFLEPEYVEQIRRVGGVRVIYEPALLPRPRYLCDHVGHSLQRTLDEERLWRGYLADAEVLFDFDHTNATTLKDLVPNARWIQGTSTGIGQFVLRTGLIHTPITFTTARGIHAKPLADFVVMAILWFAKDGPRMISGQTTRRWERYCGRDVRGATVGIIGLGTIGREVARICRAMGMRVTATKRSVSPGTREPDVDALMPLADLHGLLAETDYLALAVPHTPETEGLIGRRELDALRSGAVLINVARGVIVDETALIESLRSGHLGGAALDVFAKEPPAQDNPMWSMPNVLVGPHSASTVETENAQLTALFCDNLKRYLTGRPLVNVLDKERLY